MRIWTGSGTTRVRRGFTLIELIVVIAMIGIITAIAAPRLSAGANKVGPRASQQDLAVLQKQIELYAIEHGGVYPAYYGDGANAAHTSPAFVAQMTKYTDRQGRTSAKPVAPYRFGPYVNNAIPPVKYGPKAGSNKVKVVTGNATLEYDASAEVGWLYHDKTGQIAANAPLKLEAGGFVTDDEALEATKTSLSPSASLGK